MSAPVADVAFDLGTSSTRLIVRQRGLVLELPTCIATRDGKDREVVAIGEDARKLFGRAPEGIGVAYPVLDGLVADAVALEHFLHAVLHDLGAPALKRRRLAVAVSAELTDAERETFERTFLTLGVAEVSLVPAPFAAAVGAGLPVTDPIGSLVVDLGAGRTQAALVSLGGIVAGRSRPVGGDAIDAAIGRYLRDHHELLVADRSTEALKIRIGSVTPALHPELRMRVRGRDLTSGRPREIDLTAADVAFAVQEPLAAIRATLLDTLRETPPELAADLVDRGILLTGGTSLLRGLDTIFGEDTGLAVLHTERPTHCVAVGLTQLLEQPALLDRTEILA